MRVFFQLAVVQPGTVVHVPPVNVTLDDTV